MSGTIGKYRLIECIGRGAMGEVFKAEDQVLNRTVALKTIYGGAGMDPDDDQVRLFRREAQSAASLNHPNIVTVYDFGEIDGKLFMVMELLEGWDLKEVMYHTGMYDDAQKIGLMRQIADGVGVAHSQGIVHRDLKPANIRLLPTGVAKIMDFGLARARQAEMTRTGRVVGTPHYMSPEQVRGEMVDVRSDVFSLGIVFYELLTGRRPFTADHVHAVLFQILQSHPERPSQWKSELPKELDDILLRALSKDPDARYGDAGALREALLEIDENAEPRLELTRPPRRTVSFDDDELDRTQETLITTDLPAFGDNLDDTQPPEKFRDILNEDENPRVTFLQEEGGSQEFELEDHDLSILDLALSKDLPHFHECGKRARCSTCRVRVVEGLRNVAPRTPPEQKLASRLGWDEDIRLGCQTLVRGGNVVVQRLVRDSHDVGVLLGERQASVPAQEMAGVVASFRLRGFDHMMKKSPPYDLVHILNRFYLEIGEPVFDNGGLIQSYTSSGFLAFFGLEGGSAHEKCLQAVRAALRARARMALFRRYAKTYFSAHLELAASLHFARMIVGQLGHPSKLEISAVGDANQIVEAAQLRQTEKPCILATEELINVIEDEIEVGHVLPDEQLLAGRRTTLYEVTDLTKADAVFIVQTTFEKLESRSEEVSKLFYKILFDLDPSAMPLFADTNMDVQGQMLISMLATAVRGLDDFDSLRPVLQDLGKRHLEYGTELHHYDSVEHALLETVQRLVGEDFNLDVRLAWTQIFGKITEVMTKDLA